METENNIEQKGYKAGPLLLFSLLFGAWVREAIMGGGFGLSVLLTVAVFYVLVLWYFDFNFSAINKKAAILSIPVIFLAIGFLFHENFVSQIFAIPTLLGLIVFQTLFLFDKWSKNFISLRYVPMVFRKTFVGSINGLVKVFSQIQRTKNKRFSSEAKNVIIGLVIALPIVLILISLFSGADSKYADAINNFFVYFNISFSNIFLDIFFAAFFGFPLAACLAGLKFSPEHPPVTLQKQLFLNSTIITTVLFSLLLVALSFIAFQFDYLFNGAARSLTSQASRAIEGFTQITFASALLFSAITPVFLLAKKAAGRLPNLLRGLVVCLSISNLIILYSAVVRMMAYIDDGGLSVKRLLTMWFMILIAIALIGVVAKCFAPKFGLMQFLVITAIIGVCFLNIINVDRTVAQFNISKYISSGYTYKIDIKHLNTLSMSILPDLKALEAKMPEGKPRLQLAKVIKEKEETVAALAKRQTIFNYTLNW